MSAVLHRWFRLTFGKIHRVPELRFWEVCVMRAAFAALCWFALPSNPAYAGLPHPVGLAHFFPDLHEIGQANIWSQFQLAYGIGLVLYACGIFPLLGTGTAAAILAIAGAIEGSQGSHHHHLQIVGLALIAMAIYHFVDAFLQPNRIILSDTKAALIGVYHAQLAIVAVYLTTGIYKLVNSNFKWFAQSKNFPLQLVKNRNADYYNDLKHPDESWIAATRHGLEEFFYTYPLWCQFFMGCGLLLEVLAFLLLAGRKWAFFVGWAVILFHLTISKIMGLTFEWNMLMILIFFVNLPGIYYTFFGDRLARSENLAIQ